MDGAVLEGGFARPEIEAAQAFRQIMEAMARPGQIRQVAGAVPPAPMSVAAGVALLVLCDPETPLHLAGALDCPELRSWVAFHTGAPIAGPAEAMFAVGAWADLAPLDTYAIGSSEYPDRSATLIVELPELTDIGAPSGATAVATLSGPGIKDTACLSLPELAAFQANRVLFPLGLDFVFTCGDRLAALPRSTDVRPGGVSAAQEGEL